MCTIIVFCNDMRGQILKQDSETQKWGVLNASTGQWLILPKFDELGPVVKSERYGFLDTKVAIQWIVPVKVDGLWGIMDDSGKMKIKPKYESIGRVLNYKKTALGLNVLLNTSVLPVKYKGAWGIVDTKAKECIKPSYEEVIGAFTSKANSYNSDKDGYIVLKNHGIYVTLKANGKASGLPGFKLAHADENYFIALQADGEKWLNLYDTDMCIDASKVGEYTVIFECDNGKYNNYDIGEIKPAKPIYVFENNKLYSIEEAAAQGNANAMLLLAKKTSLANKDGSQDDKILALSIKAAIGGNDDTYAWLKEISVGKNKEFKDKVFNALKEGALKGNAAAEFYYAECIYDTYDSDIEKLKEAITWLDKAQAHGFDIGNRKNEYQSLIDSKKREAERNEKMRRQEAEEKRQHQVQLQKSKQYVKGIAGRWKVKEAGNMIIYTIKSDHTYSVQLTNRRYSFLKIRLTAKLSGTWNFDEKSGTVTLHKPNKLASRAFMARMPSAPIEVFNFVHEFNKVATNDEQKAMLDELILNKTELTILNANTMRTQMGTDFVTVIRIK